MTRPYKFLPGFSLLFLLCGCAVSQAPAAPQPLSPPALSADDIVQLQQQFYKQGYAAGRRYQKMLDQQQAAPAPAPVAPAAADAPAAPAQLAVQPAPPPGESYSPKGPAKPVATPLN